MSKSKRKVTVEGGKTDDSEKRKPSVFERLGPGAASRTGESEEKHKCRNWLLYGSCKYGDRCIHEHGPFTSGKSRRKSRHGDGSDDGESPDKHHHKSKHRKGKERGHRSDSPSKGRKDSDKTLKSQVSVKAGHGDDSSASGDSPFDDLDFNDELRLEQKRQELERQLRQLQPSDHEDERENIPVVQKKVVVAESSGSESDKDAKQKKHHKTVDKNKSHKKAKKKKKSKGLKFLKKKAAADSSDDSDEGTEVVQQPVEEPSPLHHRHYKKSSHKAEEEYVPPVPPPEEQRHHHHHRHKDQAPSAPPAGVAEKSDSDSANEQASHSRSRKDRRSAGPTRVASISPLPKKKKKVAGGRQESVEETDRAAHQRYRKSRLDDSSDDDSKKGRGRGQNSREEVPSKDRRDKEEERRPREDNLAVRRKRQQELSDDERRKLVKETVDRHRKRESIEVVKDSSSDDDERDKSSSSRHNRSKSDSKKRRRSSPEAREKSHSPPLPANRGRQHIRERSAESSHAGDRRKQSYDRVPRKPVDMSPAKRDDRNRAVKPSSPEARRPVKDSNNRRQTDRGEREEDRGDRDHDKDNRDRDSKFERDHPRDHRIHVRPSDSPDERILIEENRLRKEFGEAFAFARSDGRGPGPPPMPGPPLHIDERRGERIGPPPGFDGDHPRLDREGFGREPPPREPPPGGPFRFNDRDRGPPPPKIGRFEDGREGPRPPSWEFERDRRDGDWGRGPPPRDLPPQRDPPRDMPPRDLPPRDLPPRDLPPRDLPPRDLSPRDLPPRDSGGRDFPHPMERGSRGYDEPPRSSDQHMSRRGDWDNRRPRDDIPPERGFPGPVPVLAPEWIERHREVMDDRFRDPPDNQRFPARRDEPEFFGELLDARPDSRDMHPRGLPLPPLLPPAEFHDQRDPERRDGRVGDRRRDRPPSPAPPPVKEDDRSRDRREDSRKRGLEEPDRGRSPSSKKTRNESPTGSHRSRSSIGRGDERERENRGDRDRDRARGNDNRERDTGTQRGGPRPKDREAEKRDSERDRAKERERTRDNERRDRDKDSRSDTSHRTPSKDDRRFNRDSRPPADKVDSKSTEKKQIKEEEKADKDVKDAKAPAKKDDKEKHKHKSRGKHGNGKKSSSKGEPGKDAEGEAKSGKKKSGSSASSSSGSGSSGSDSDSSSKSVDSTKKSPKTAVKKESEVTPANEKKVTDDKQSVKSLESQKSEASTVKKKGGEASRGPDGTFKPKIAGEREVFSDWSTEDDVDDEILAMPENELAKQKQLAAGEAVPAPPTPGMESAPLIKRPHSISSIGSHRSHRSVRSLRETERDSLKGSKSVSSGRRNSTEKTKDSTLDDPPEIISVKSIQNIDDRDSDDTGLLGNAMDLEAISDDEDVDWNDEHKEAQPVDALDLDWAGLMTEKPKPATSTPAKTSALSRFRASQVFQRIGVSRMFAGDALFQRLLDVCQKQVEEDAENADAAANMELETKDEKENGSASDQKAKTKPVFELHHGIAAFHMAIVKKLHDRENLFHNVGPNRRALVARRDLNIRRQLCKVE